MTHPNTELITNKITLEFSKTIEMFGLTTLEARLFVLLYLSNEPLTLDEMSDTLGKSKTSMSTSIRSLSELNLATRVWKKGIRKDLYQANTHLFKTFMNSYIKKWIDAANQQTASLEEIYQSIDYANDNNEQKEEMENVCKQLCHIIEFHRDIEDLFKRINLE
jgi:DNA-binding transcriptional regulator GbsR (MarR family)